MSLFTYICTRDEKRKISTNISRILTANKTMNFIFDSNRVIRELFELTRLEIGGVVQL